MKDKIRDFLINGWEEIEFSLKRLCGKPSRMKRFFIVSLFGGTLFIAYIYSLYSAIYESGKNDVRREIMELKSIEPVKLKSDSAFIIKN